jgi:hypothetical protein
LLAILKRQNFWLLFFVQSCPTPARFQRSFTGVSASVHSYVNNTEIRSGEENRKKYGVPDVKIPERKKRWRALIVFKIDRDF